MPYDISVIAITGTAIVERGRNVLCKSYISCPFLNFVFYNKHQNTGVSTLNCSYKENTRPYNVLDKIISFLNFHSLTDSLTQLALLTATCCCGMSAAYHRSPQCIQATPLYTRCACTNWLYTVLIRHKRVCIV